ncbi:outer membrane protein [Bradyrhizobium sp. HKCCYLS2058]|uniref:outer membrane protein n=1 Tax=Bradyrhizobium TaxID=374 RepID=UPI0029166FBE|nr:outer membrane beta-barrel protein [Bradyrhizobium sp. SZCCHNR1015]
MRSLVVAVSVCGMISAAQAADLSDLPILRGSMTEGLNNSRVNWDGYYVGVQGGYGSSDENFNGSTKNMTAAVLANTLIESQMQVSSWNPNLGKQSSRASGFGAFVGYNSQWDDVVLGVEASYLHGKYGGMASSSRTLVSTAALTDGNFHAVTSTQSSQISITDMATIRGRAGYAMGCFLPYAFFGLALGNADIGQSVTVQDRVSTTFLGTYTPLAPLSANNLQHNHLIYGYSAGLGVDVNLVGGLFARAEYEYVRFTSTVDTSINTVRAGLGYKF